LVIGVFGCNAFFTTHSFSLCCHSWALSTSSPVYFSSLQAIARFRRLLSLCLSYNSNNLPLPTYMLVIFPMQCASFSVLPLLVHRANCF
jgi:hypothetical protein